MQTTHTEEHQNVAKCVAPVALSGQQKHTTEKVDGADDAESGKIAKRQPKKIVNKKKLSTVVGQVSGGTGTRTGHVIRNRCRSVLTHSPSMEMSILLRLSRPFSLSPVLYPLITANSI